MSQVFEMKICLHANMSAFKALYFLCLVFFVSGSRFFVAAYPLVNKDPTIVKFGNKNIIQ